MDKLLKKYSIGEISEKTRISPIILSKLLNGEFEKIDLIKLKGFLKILENEYKDIDFSELKEKIEEFSEKQKTILKKEKKDISTNYPKNNGLNIYFIVFLLLGLIGISFYYLQKEQKEKENISVTKKEVNHTNFLQQNYILEENFSEKLDENSSEKVETISNNSDEDILNENIELNETLSVVPIQKVWFKVYYLDDNSSKEYLTTKQVDLNGSRKMFMKFGHGNVKFFYNDNEFFPNSKKVIRIIVENGEINITEKKLKEFK